MTGWLVRTWVRQKMSRHWCVSRGACEIRSWSPEAWREQDVFQTANHLGDFCLILFCFPVKLTRSASNTENSFPVVSKLRKKTDIISLYVTDSFFFHGHVLKTFRDRGYTSNALVNRKQSHFLLCYRCIFRLICLSFLSVRRCHPSLGL